MTLFFTYFTYLLTLLGLGVGGHLALTMHSSYNSTLYHDPLAGSYLLHCV